MSSANIASRLLRLAQIEHLQIGPCDSVVQPFEGTDVVKNPDRTPVRGKDQVVIARMDLDVIDRHCRQPVLDLRPIRPAVE